MRTYYQALIFAIALLTGPTVWANEEKPETTTPSIQKKRFSIDGMAKFDFEGILLNPNVAITDNISVGLLFPVPGPKRPGIDCSLVVDYYFHSFDQDSFFLEPHIGTETSVTKKNKRQALTYGMDFGYRFFVGEHLTVRPMLMSAQSSATRGVVVIPFLMLGYTW